MKILFLIPYPLKESPSQRFRFEQYFLLLESNGYQSTVQSFFNSAEWTLFYSKGNAIKKFIALLRGYLKRIVSLFNLGSYDYVFIHREVTPIGSPLFEWVIAKVFRKKIIFDFDDAIWLTDKENEHWITGMLRWRSKTASICRWSYKISCGNAFLANYAKSFHDQVVINPTTIDTVHLHKRELYSTIQNQSSEFVTIGWTGSHSTLKYLTLVESALQNLEQRFPHLRFLIIADRQPDLSLSRLEFQPWNIQTEISDLVKMDIGIMPLPDDLWSKGKCGFKALQYMALQIPCVASPVGVNTEIIQQGVNGFLAASLSEWEEYLARLILYPDLRIKIGMAGFQTVQKNYSVTSNEATFLSLFR